MKPKRSSPIQGFSLIELMIVIGVIGLLLAAAAPGMSRYLNSARFSGAVNTLAADIHQTRARANAERRTFQITFTTNSYTIVQTSPDATIRTRPLPRGVSCTASAAATFFAWGLTSPADITITHGAASKTLHVLANGSVTRD